MRPGDARPPARRNALCGGEPGDYPHRLSANGLRRDDVATTNLAYNDNAHISACATYGSDTGTDVKDGGQAQRYDGGGYYYTNTFGVAAAVRKIGEFYEPADGYIQHADIAGYALLDDDGGTRRHDQPRSGRHPRLPRPGPAKTQWLERLGYTYTPSATSSLALGVRRIIDTAPLLDATVPQSYTNAYNLSFSFHQRMAHDELYVAYGDASQLSTLPQFVIKLIHYFGAEKGT